MGLVRAIMAGFGILAGSLAFGQPQEAGAALSSRPARHPDNVRHFVVEATGDVFVLDAHVPRCRPVGALPSGGHR